MTVLPPTDTIDPLLAGLNPQQRQAVEYRGPALLIVAGAGSGKTRVLTHRIAHLIRGHEAWPSQILAITFTNKAAGEMRERVGALLGEAAEGMWISTFHSACVRILRREAEVFGFTKAFTIYDSADTRVVIKRIIKDLGADVHGFTVAGTANRISALKNELADIDSYARSANFEDPAETMFVEIFRRYTRDLVTANALDFDDLLAQTVYLFRAFPAIADTYRRKFRHILVDEYQDTNHAQYALIHELTRPPSPENQLTPGGQIITAGASLTVVGDSDQSIYAFRGADIRNISEFERDFPGASVILLEQNYRSTQNILSAANAVIGNNFDRKDKRLWTAVGDGEKLIAYTGYTAHDEAQFVADEIDALHSAGMPYNQIAVFYRTNAQTRALEEILIRSGVPYRVLGGTKFYERAEIKDALAYLVAVANPADELALRRILNTPRRGIGPATETALARFAETGGISFRESMRRVGEQGFGPKVTASVRGLSDLLDAVADTAEAASVAETLTALIDGSGLVSALKATRDPQDEVRVENVEELVAVTRDFTRNNPDGTLIDFLTEVSLVAAVDDLDDSSGTVSLMTLHTAKGLEYDAVFLTGIEEGLLPHRMSAGEPGGPAEERRLFYVGITRARKRLFLSLAMSRAQYGGIESQAPSRYLTEIPAELIEWRQSAGGVAPSGSIGGPRFNRSAPSRSELGLPPAPKHDFPNRVTAQVRDNGDLELAAGDRIRHHDFGEGRVAAVTGEGPKRIAEVSFDTAGRKKLLIKIAPIEKL